MAQNIAGYKGWFNSRAHQEECDMVEKGIIKQLESFTIPVTAAGDYNNGRELRVNANSLMIMPNIGQGPLGAGAGGGILTSSSTAILLVRFNKADNPWIPFSLATGFLSAAVGSIFRVWIKVQTIDSDVTAHPQVILMFTQSFGLTEGVTTTAAYGPPTGGSGSSGGSSSGGSGSGSGSGSGGGGSSGGYSGGGSGGNKGNTF